ncbi:MAG: thiamine phosphate synthase, partial [Terriglobales bacterium]
MIKLPRLYAILDVWLLPGYGLPNGPTGVTPVILGGDARRSIERLLAVAEEMAAGGATLLQYRNKSGNARQILEQARELKRLLGNSVKLIMNDRADLCVAAGFDGLHLGQDDLSPEDARKVTGPNLMLGISTHSLE